MSTSICVWVIRAAAKSTVFRWRKALASSDHLTGSRVSRYLNFAEQRRESYNGIVSEVKTRGSSSLQHPWHVPRISLYSGLRKD
jgi:hypothetical protein